MKIFILILLFLVAVTIFARSKPPPLIPSPTPQPNPTVSVSPVTSEIEVGETVYRIYLQKIIAPDSIILIDNFSQKELASTLFKSNNCNFGVNGGFYTKGNKPLGLFFTNGKWWEKIPSPNKLFNGYLYKTKAGSFNFDTTIPDTSSLEFVFQSGPIFTPTSKLAIIDDEPARRILVGKTDSDEIYFVALTDVDNTNTGPLLADLPNIIKQFNSSYPSIIHDSSFNILLNLDGGSASTFVTPNIKLSEITPVGSFLCGKQDQ